MAAPVLILGGSGGVGSALARSLASEGIPTHLFARDQGRSFPSMADGARFG